MILPIRHSEPVKHSRRNTRGTVPAKASVESNAEHSAENAVAPSTEIARITTDPKRSRRKPSVWFHRPHAPFLAHLIATHKDMPQTRVRRRASTGDANAAYRGGPVSTDTPKAGATLHVIT